MPLKPVSSGSCPHCGKGLPTVAKQLRSLKAEIKQLRKYLNEYEDEHGDIHGAAFVASTSRPHFHRPDCTWASYISQSNILEFFSHKEATQAGYKPCKTCRA